MTTDFEKLQYVQLEKRMLQIVERFMTGWPEAEPSRHMNSTDAYRVGYGHGAREVAKQIYNEIQSIKCGA